VYGRRRWFGRGPARRRSVRGRRIGQHGVAVPTSLFESVPSLQLISRLVLCACPSWDEYTLYRLAAGRGWWRRPNSRALAFVLFW
jgi:hypothetical protein